MTTASAPSTTHYSPTAPETPLTVTITPGPLSVDVVGQQIIITVPRDPSLSPSSTGKSRIVASTRGFHRVTGTYNGHPLKINLTAFIANVPSNTDDSSAEESFKFNVAPGPGSVQAAMSKGTFVLSVPLGEERLSSTGKMRLIGPEGGNVSTDLYVDGHRVKVNLTVGYTA